jgi:hypothetical protein
MLVPPTFLDTQSSVVGDTEPKTFDSTRPSSLRFFLVLFRSALPCGFIFFRFHPFLPPTSTTRFSLPPWRVDDSLEGPKIKTKSEQTKASNHKKEQPKPKPQQQHKQE